MAEPRSKRPRGTLPACQAHRAGPSSRVRHSFPAAVEEGVCGVTSALLELAYCLQALGEYFDQSHVALPNVSKFFLHQALEERKAAEALMKYQQERGGHYCSKTIQKPNCEYAVGLMKALELAMVQWKTMVRYFEELYALSIENADPHSASTIKKQFIGPKIQKIKLMGDLLTNARRLDCSQDGRNSLGDYFMDRLQEEFRTGIEPCLPLQQCTGAAEALKQPPRESSQHRNGIGPICATIHCATMLPQRNGGIGAKVKQGREGL
ncbi:ferritin light chain-like isoform X2 [Melopsittacus undulatus]|uniref:Ferritin n=1 Tax=Melopsittacus undulatus TaxID=13146 RepID=A0A8C6JVH1_MELUD|nr:ferritin light chain-like isoform X2 [Melopsittacus undulatus]